MRLERINDDYFTVYDDAGRELGSVVGGGPTYDTRWKAVSRNDNYMNPDEAPARGYAPSKEKAAQFLSH